MAQAVATFAVEGCAASGIAKVTVWVDAACENVCQGLGTGANCRCVSFGRAILRVSKCGVWVHDQLAQVGFFGTVGVNATSTDTENSAFSPPSLHTFSYTDYTFCLSRIYRLVVPLMIPSDSVVMKYTVFASTKRLQDATHIITRLLRCQGQQIK
jgi:hypothetical protein